MWVIAEKPMEHFTIIENGEIIIEIRNIAKITYIFIFDKYIN